MSSVSARTGQFAPARDNLPLQLTRFVGRDAELAQIRQKLAEERLVTLIGTGGVGKTRLGLEVATAARAQFDDGVCLVELGALTDPALVPQALAGPLGVRAEAQVPLTYSLITFLASRRMLLLLDNCEQLIETCASLVDTLLRACPDVHILATSRQPLRTAGEWVCRVAPLPVSDSVKLFVDRAAAVAGFVLDDSSAPAVTRVCQRLDGIPLALELAAARVPALGVSELAERLDDALRVLTQGSRTAPARHQTLRATIDWSYGLLSETEQTLLDRLSVFAGGFTCDAAEATTAGVGDVLEPDAVLDVLTRLVDRSLVVAEPAQHGGMHYRLLDVVRQYGLARLSRRRELGTMRRRHALFFLDRVQRAESGVLRRERERWQDRLERDLDNFRAARTWFVAQGDAESALRLNAYLFLLLAYRGYASEGRASLQEALDLTGGSAATRGRALHCLALLAYLQADYAAAAQYGEQSLTLRRAVGDPTELAWSLLERGTTACARAEFDTALPLLEECRAASEAGGARYLLAYSQALLGYVEYLRIHPDAARRFAQAALQLADRYGFVAPASHALATLGEISAFERDHEAASEALATALDRARAPGEAFLVSRPLLGLALVATDQHDFSRARAVLEESLKVAQRLGNPHRTAQILERVAIFANRAGRADTAGRLIGAAASIRTAVGAPSSPVEQRVLAERLGALVKRGPDFDQGTRLSLDQAVAAALECLGSEQRSEPAAADAPQLTPREREVAALVARGLTNREIASTLTIAERTVTSHVEHVLNKLGFHTRAQIATWVTSQRVYPQ